MTATQPHPTAEEWAARRANAPPELLALAAKGEADDARDKAHRDEIWAAVEKLNADRRREFESALARLLDAEGAGWLTAYRACDSSFAGPHRLDSVHRAWFAEFALARFGFHNIRVELTNDTGRHTWTPSRAPFGVILPGGTRWCSSLAEAVRVASRYAPAPF